MLFAVDFWHKEWGFGFTLWLWEAFDSPIGLIKLSFEWQIKLFGRRWGSEEDTDKY